MEKSGAKQVSLRDEEPNRDKSLKSKLNKVLQSRDVAGA